jgi:hypothetical protein
MRDPIAVILQAVVSLAIVGFVMPMVLAEVPPARDNRVGLLVAAVVLGTTFVVIRLLWPGKRSQSRD